MAIKTATNRMRPGVEDAHYLVYSGQSWLNYKTMSCFLANDPALLAQGLQTLLVFGAFSGLLVLRRLRSDFAAMRGVFGS